MTMGVSKSTAGLFRKIYSQAQSAAVGPDELAMWGDFGERTVILWADTEQHIKVIIKEVAQEEEAKIELAQQKVVQKEEEVQD